MITNIQELYTTANSILEIIKKIGNNQIVVKNNYNDINTNITITSTKFTKNYADLNAFGYKIQDGTTRNIIIENCDLKEWILIEILPLKIMQPCRTCGKSRGYINKPLCLDCLDKEIYERSRKCRLCKTALPDYFPNNYNYCSECFSKIHNSNCKVDTLPNKKN